MIDTFKLKFKDCLTDVERDSMLTMKDLLHSLSCAHSRMALNYGTEVLFNVISEVIRCPDQFVTKPILIKRILTNFITNSIKYSKTTSTTVDFEVFRSSLKLLE